MDYKVRTKEDLELFAYRNLNALHAYIDDKMKGLPVPLTSSVDIRESKEKYANVDHNLYPAGFNNLCSLDLDASVPLFKKALEKAAPGARAIGLIPESHTKNTLYLDHLWTLADTLGKTGLPVHIVSLDPAMFEDGHANLQLQSNSKGVVVVHRGEVRQGRVVLVDRAQEGLDVLVMNHDQSNPLNVDWGSLTVPALPSPFMGWYRREKNKHFAHYKRVTDEFCNHFGIDPDLMQAKFKAVEDVDFSTKQGLDRLGEAVDELKSQLPADASIFAKASKGTYGMGIMVVKSGEEIISMNRKERNKMNVGKNQIKFTSVLLQEGIETAVKYDGLPAEITVYLVDGRPAGAFMRANSERGTMANLNSRGMVFIKFCMSQLCQGEEHRCKECVYSLIARLATLASAHELREAM